MRATLVALSTAAALALTAAAQAGPVFLTGHDPDFHAQPGLGSPGAPVLLETGLSFATGGTYNKPGHKFLWVESNLPVVGGHVVGQNSLIDIGLAAGVNYDAVDAAGLATADLTKYTAIAIASDFGGMLSKAEINELVARKADIASFINAGGGLFASAECGVGFPDCEPSLVDSSTDLFGFLPVTVTSVATTPPYHVTPYGASLGLTDADMNDPTHNSFGAVGGLNIVDTDNAGVPTTLAGNVNVGGGGFTPTPEPATLALLGGGLLVLAGLRRRR